MSTKFSSVKETTDFIFAKVGHDLRLATPLGLGKPNLLLNEIYDRVVADKSKTLKIYTALSLTPPSSGNELAKRFLEPFAKRQWGESYPALKYFTEAMRDRVPANIEVHEFYYQAGLALNSNHLQRHYQSVNYTHAAQNILQADVNVLVQLIAEKNGKYSLSCNPDLTVDVADLFKEAGKKIVLIGVVHPDLPFLGGDAEVEEKFFDGILQAGEPTHQLFALPREPISLADHLIGLYSSFLVRDGGTLQIGIGSLSEALVSALCIRQKSNDLYIKLAELAGRPRACSELFTEGLYGLTEMLTDGFMHLRNAGILKRFIIDESTGLKTYLHGSFILGSKDLYKWLRELSGTDAAGLRMTSVLNVNDLYDPNEALLRRQRIHGRFFNTAMQVSLLGEVMSETLPNGKVVSGVGGQYNFVSMARELKGSLSVIMLRSWRVQDGQRASNIIWSPGHTTIPRHLRDVVVTEYGIADLRGKTDEECIQNLINIADSAFQKALLEAAQAQGKISRNYKIPEMYLNNTPEKLKQKWDRSEFKTVFEPFPFGSDFTREEEKLAIALGQIQNDQKLSKVRLIQKIFTSGNPSNWHAELKRMGLEKPVTVGQWLYKRLLLGYLESTNNS